MVLSMVREMLKGGADVHFGSSDDLERPEHNPTVIAMLGAAGLNGVDIQLFDTMQQSGASVFVHGSLVSGRIANAGCGGEHCRLRVDIGAEPRRSKTKSSY